MGPLRQNSATNLVVDSAHSGKNEFHRNFIVFVKFRSVFALRRTFIVTKEFYEQQLLDDTKFH